jgi:predicted HicB family RNase H-like nuclease
MLFDSKRRHRASMSSKLKQVAVRIEPEVHEKLQQRAKADQRSLASLVRLIVQDATQDAAVPASEAR